VAAQWSSLSAHPVFTASRNDACCINYRISPCVSVTRRYCANTSERIVEALKMEDMKMTDQTAEREIAG